MPKRSKPLELDKGYIRYWARYFMVGERIAMGLPPHKPISRHQQKIGRRKFEAMVYGRASSTTQEPEVPRG
jgi:hypothetical protein